MEDQLSQKDKERLETLLKKLSQSEFDKKVIENENDSLRKLTIDAFKTFEINKYHLEFNEKINDEIITKVINFTLVQPNQIIYDLPSLKGKFEKDELKRFVDTTYFLNDVEGFKEMLAKYKVPNKEVKKFIQKEEKLREDKLKKLYEIGEVAIEKLAGCYTIKEKTEYLKVMFGSK